MVLLSPKLEWYKYVVLRAEARFCWINDVSCLGKLGLWGLQFIRGLVPASVAGILAEVSYYGEGVTPGGAWIAVWGPLWRGQRIRCLTDNAAVVAIVKSGSCNDPLAMHLLRSLFFILARYNIAVWCVHLPGVKNTAADALLRDNLASFLSQPRKSRQSFPGIYYKRWCWASQI